MSKQFGEIFFISTESIKILQTNNMKIHQILKSKLRSNLNNTAINRSEKTFRRIEIKMRMKFNKSKKKSVF